MAFWSPLFANFVLACHCISIVYRDYVIVSEHFETSIVRALVVSSIFFFNLPANAN